MSDTPARVDFDVAPPMEVTRYDDTISRFVPGYDAIYQMALAYLRTTIAADARVLVVGAGSGKELVTFSTAMPGWLLTGVDPSAHMLAVARAKLAQSELAERVTLRQGVTDDLPHDALFDAATCILVMHFLPDDGAKLALLSSIAAHLKSGAPLLLVDGCDEADFSEGFDAAWVAHAAQMGLSGAPMERLEKTQATLHKISEARSRDLFVSAGFASAQRFYSAFFYNGWIATKAG